MIQIETIEQLQAFLADNPNSVILKHSTSCSISANAYQEFLSSAPDSPVRMAIVLVIEARQVSDHLTELTGVEHKSPQALIFKNSECYKNFSHSEITADNIKAAL